MNSNFQESIVLITSRDDDNRRFGTGFIISNSEHKVIVITCSHLINEIGGPDKILVDDIPADLIINGDDLGLDLAVLEIEFKSDMPVLYMNPSANSGETFTTAGFQQYNNNCLLIRRLHGKLGESVFITHRGNKTRIKAWDLSITDDFQLQPGYSGSPIIGENGHVIGVVSHRQGTGSKGLGISIKALSLIWKKSTTELPEMEQENMIQFFNQVTNNEYLDFLNQTGHRKPMGWSCPDKYFEKTQGDCPVSGVAWDDAVEYCDWKGRRLPFLKDKFFKGKAKKIVTDSHNIEEWLDWGNEQEKCVYNNNSHTIRMQDRISRLNKISFRCIPVQPVILTHWITIDGGSYKLGTDVEKFNRYASLHHIPLTLSKPILGRPSRLYNIDSYSISATCITNEEFYEFTRAAGMPWPCHWDSKWLKHWNRPFPPRLASQPVVNVSVDQAQAYCIRSRTRLPKWSEWERAASGPNRQSYPWGSDFNAAYCNCIENGRGSLAAVNEFSLGASEGLHQLCGNVAEWVVSPDGQFEIRGGSYMMECKIWGLAYTFIRPEPGFYSPDIGFRVVVD